MDKRIQKFLAIAACLLMAVLPPWAFVYYLEKHAVTSAEETLGDYARRMVDHLEATIDQGVLALTDLAGTGAMRCDTEAIENMRRKIFDAYVLREIAVVDRSGDTICADTIFKAERWTLSRQPTVNRLIDVSVVTDETTFLRSLALRLKPAGDRGLVAHFAANSLGLDVLPDRWRSAGQARLSLLDGTEFQTVPSRDTDDTIIAGDTIGATVVSNRYPLSVDIRVDRNTIMRDYQAVKNYALTAMGVFAVIILGIATLIARQRPTIGDDIARALRAGEFIPYYQPVINLNTGRIEGCEVLVRRRRKNGSIESPGVFIAQAEADGQIIPMTQQLMQRSIADLGEIYGRYREMTVAFNLCARHFEDEQIVHDVQRIFESSPVGTSQLVFEVTERFPVADTVMAMRVIADLQAIGAKVALDDAGTGHSGLATLHRLGMDIVKIDKLFIDPIRADTKNAPIVDSLVDLAKNLGMSVVAEGVETMEQVEYLKSRGVDSAQGYLFAPPLPGSSYVALVKAMHGSNPSVRHEAAESADSGHAAA